MSKNSHDGKKRQKQRRHFRRQVDIAHIWQQGIAGRLYVIQHHCAYLCVHASHLRGLRAQVKHFIIAALSSGSLNNLPSSPWVPGRPWQNNGKCFGFTPDTKLSNCHQHRRGREPEVDL